MAIVDRNDGITWEESNHILASKVRELNENS
jgi:hypothetical protein